MMKHLRKADIVLIAVLVVSAPVFWFLNRYFLAEKGGVYAEIYHDSVLVSRINLSTAKEGTFSIPGEPNVAFHQYADGSIAFIKSDCPDKICIRSGRLKHMGQFAACLPNRIVLKIVSEGEEREGPDLIIQ